MPRGKISPFSPFPPMSGPCSCPLESELTGGLGQHCPQGAKVGEPQPHWAPAREEGPMACSPQHVAVCGLHTPGTRGTQCHGLLGVRVPEPGPAPCLGGSCQCKYSPLILWKSVDAPRRAQASPSFPQRPRDTFQVKRRMRQPFGGYQPYSMCRCSLSCTGNSPPPRTIPLRLGGAPYIEE